MVFAARKVVVWAVSSVALALVACAPVPPQTTPVGRTQLTFEDSPQAQWRYWGADHDLIPVSPRDISRDEPLESKVWQMRTALGELVAIVAVRSNVNDLERQPTVWTQDCPKQQGTLVERTQGLNVGRVDCLRIKRTANHEDWLQANDPRMAARIKAAGIYFARPVSHIAYQYTTGNGGYVDVQVLVDHRLVRPETRNSIDFFSAGRPLVAWAQDLSLAVRQSTGYLNGVLKVPAFPYGVDQKPYYEESADQTDRIPGSLEPSAQTNTNTNTNTNTKANEPARP